MSGYNRLRARYEAAFQVAGFASLFPEIENAIQVTFPREQGFTIRVRKTKKRWTLFCYKGITSGFRIDFFPLGAAFESPTVRISVQMYSRLFAPAMYLSAGLYFATLGFLHLTNILGWAVIPNLTLWLVPTFVGIFFAMLFGSIIGFCAYIGGRFERDRLTAIGELTRNVLEKGGGRETKPAGVLTHMWEKLDESRQDLA